jgi:hypothetical protein
VDEVPAESVGGLESCAHRSAAAAKGLWNLVAEIDAMRLEGLFAGELDTESVRLMHEFRDQYASRHRLFDLIVPVPAYFLASLIGCCRRGQFFRAHRLPTLALLLTPGGCAFRPDQTVKSWPAR